METQVSFSAKDVMALRQKTGLGMMDCKKALVEKNGDMEAAEKWMREKRKGKMDTRTERTTGEGRIGIVIDGDKAVMIEVQTETDFTARNEAFVKMVEAVTADAMSHAAGDVTASAAMTKLVDDIRITTGENANFARGIKMEGGSYGCYVHHDGKRACLLQIDGSVDAEVLTGVCQHIVFSDPAGISEDDVDASVLEGIRTKALEEAEKAGKNEEIAGKIADGKVRRHLQDCTLMNQKFIKDETKTITEVLGKDVKVTKFVRYTLGA